MLRILVIALLVVLALRLAARLLLELARRATPPPPAPPPSRAPRQLVRCPVCGDYFEEHRGLPVPVAARRGAAPLEVCSEECRARSAEARR